MPLNDICRWEKNSGYCLVYLNEFFFQNEKYSSYFFDWKFHNAGMNWKTVKIALDLILMIGWIGKKPVGEKWRDSLERKFTYISLFRSLSWQLEP
jgi:hypothetical protein